VKISVLVLCVISAFERSLMKAYTVQESRAVVDKPRDAAVNFDICTEIEIYSSIARFSLRLRCILYFIELLQLSVVCTV